MPCRRLSLGCLLLLVTPSLAAAQSFEADSPFWEIAVQPGFLAPEEPEGAEVHAGPLFSLRAGYRRAAGFGVEAHAGYTFLDFEVKGRESQDFDLDAFLYGADVTYAWSIRPRSDFFISTGLGGITWNLGGETGVDDHETNLRLTLGAGLRYLILPRLGVRADVRDHIIFKQLADIARSFALVDRGSTNNLEGSIGVSFLP